MEVLEAIFVAGVETVPSVHLQLALSHLFGLFDLVLRKLHGRWLVNLLLLRSGSRLGLLILLRLLLLVVVGRLLGAGLLRYLAFHKIDGVLLELLANLLLLTVPLVFKSVGAVSLVLRDVLAGLFFTVLRDVP